MRVDGGEHIIEQNDRRVRVARARKIDPLLLAAAQVHASFADLRRVAGGQQGHVGSERASIQDGVVALLVKRRPEQNVVAQRRVGHPCALGAVGHSPGECNLAFQSRAIAKERRQKAGFAAARRTADQGELTGPDGELNIGESSAQSGDYRRLGSGFGCVLCGS